MPSEKGTETRKDWEVVQEDVNKSKTERLRVASGWLYRTTVVGEGVAMCFAPAMFGE